MLVAIVDCIDESELLTLVGILKRDGFTCLSCEHVSIDVIHDTIRDSKDIPVIIYGSRSIDLPYDDCERLWLGCGPQGYEAEYDERVAKMMEAWRASNEPSLATFGATFDVNKYQESETLANNIRRRSAALRCGFRLCSFVETISFAATFLATQTVNTADQNAQDILLRHVHVKPSKTFH